MLYDIYVTESDRSCFFLFYFVAELKDETYTKSRDAGRTKRKTKSPIIANSATNRKN